MAEMTLDELLSKREEILRTIGILRVQFGERSVQYSDQARALAAIDAEIARLQQTQRSVSYAEFKKG
jgi:hypothetical protein